MFDFVDGRDVARMFLELNLKFLKNVDNHGWLKQEVSCITSKNLKFTTLSLILHN